MNRWLVRLAWLLPPALVFVWLVGQLVRDRWWITGLCFYFPSPLAVGLLLTGAVIAWKRCRLRLAALYALVALGPVLCVVLIENHWRKTSAESTAEDFRLVHWNVFYGSLGWPGVRANLRDAGADFYLLSEVPGSEPVETFLADLGPDFVGTHLASMAVFARGEIRTEAMPTPSGRVTTFGIHWKCRGQAISVLAVDLPSSLSVARDPLLREVRDLIANTRPDIVLGDFNAPRRSIALSGLPPGYDHAYAQVGTGWGYTWPVPAPLWAIDQCILGPRVAATDYQLRSTMASDHRLQLLMFGCRQD